MRMAAGKAPAGSAGTLAGERGPSRCSNHPRGVFFGVLRNRMGRQSQKKLKSLVALKRRCCCDWRVAAVAIAGARSEPPCRCGLQVALVRCVVGWKRREPGP
jgi:hypothetical protein